MRARLFVLTCVVWAAVGGHAHGQSAGGAAEIEFDKGRELMTAGKYAEACDAFGKSEKLDPQIGTRYNIGRCLEEQGKLASAWEAYREVAQRDSNDGRRKDAAKRADALQPRLTKLLVNSAASPVGFVVKVNGADTTNLLGIETPVDPGPYTVIASAPGFKAWSASVTAAGDGLTVTVAIPALEKLGDATTSGPPPRSEPGKATTTIAHLEAAPVPEPSSPEPVGHGRRVLGIGIGGGGVLVLAGGLVAGAMASSKWSSAKNVCGGMLTCPSAADTAQANALADSARTRANIATGLIGVGAVAIGVGAALWLTAPHESRGVALVPSAGPGGVSLTMEGRF